MWTPLFPSDTLQRGMPSDLRHWAASGCDSDKLASKHADVRPVFALLGLTDHVYEEASDFTFTH
jgi:hypothetical protein